VSGNRQTIGAFGVLLLIGAAIFGTATLVVVSGDPPRWAFAVVTAMVTLVLVVIALYTKGR
jgi:uncharacterized protein (DUF983 family)